jgi:hypothetical protein
MRSNRVNGLVRKAASVGVIFLFCGGVGPWLHLQPRVASGSSSGCCPPSDDVHAAPVHVHATAVHVHAPVHAHAAPVHVHATTVHVHATTVHVHTTSVHARYVHGRAVHRRRAARPVYAHVNVHVAVHPVYPVAGLAYPVYPAGWPYIYPYPYWIYAAHYPDLSAEGYSDGFHRGQDDAEDHRSYDPYRKGYRNPGSATYDAGFLHGYAAGYGH